MGGNVFFSQNHARTEDFSWESSDCKRCKFLCRKMRISWNMMKFGPVDVFFFGEGGGRKYHLSRNSGRRCTLVVPSDIFFGATQGSRLASINKHVGYIHVLNINNMHGQDWTSSQDASEKDASWFTSFLLK